LGVLLPKRRVSPAETPLSPQDHEHQMTTARVSILRAASNTRDEVRDAAAAWVDVGTDGAHVVAVLTWWSVVAWEDVKKSVRDCYWP
jgi:hypothetical protein